MTSIEPACARLNVIAMMIHPMVSSMIADETMIWPRLRRVKFISRTIAATILIEEIDSAVPRNNAVSSRLSASGRSDSGISSPSARPQANGTATPVSEMLMAARPTFCTSLRSVSIPVSSSSSRMPNCDMASIIAFWSGDAGKIACCRSGQRAPRIDGPSRIPASNCPITEGWPIRCMASPRRRPTIMRIRIWARKMISEAPLLSPAAQALPIPSRVNPATTKP